MTSTVDTAFKVFAHHQEDRVKSLPMCLKKKSWFFHTSCEKQMKCVGPQVKDDDLWSMIWDYKHRIDQEGMLRKV